MRYKNKIFTKINLLKSILFIICIGFIFLIAPTYVLAVIGTCTDLETGETFPCDITTEKDEVYDRENDMYYCADLTISEPLGRFTGTYVSKNWDNFVPGRCDTGGGEGDQFYYPTPRRYWVCEDGGQCIEYNDTSYRRGYNSLEGCAMNCYPNIKGEVFIDEDADGMKDPADDDFGYVVLGNLSEGELNYPGTPLGTYKECRSVSLFDNCSSSSCLYGMQCVSGYFCTSLNFFGLGSNPILDSGGYLNQCTEDCSFFSRCVESSTCCRPNYQGLTVTLVDNESGEQYTLTTSTYESVDSDYGVFNSYNLFPDGIESGSYTVALTLPNGYFNTTLNPRLITVENNPPVDVTFGITTDPSATTTTTTKPTLDYSLQGIVFLDDNENNQKEEYEPCYDGLLNITAGDKTVSFSSTEECNTYLISGLNQCPTSVQISIPSGYKLTGWYGTSITGEDVSGLTAITTSTICE